jgi:PKD repeat protein
MTGLRGFAALVAAAVLGGCMMQNQTAPILSGPSGLGKLLKLSPREDVLPRDGSSQTVVDVEYTDTYNNTPIANVRLILGTTAGTLSVPEVRTDAAGRAAFTYMAPGVNTPVSSAVISAVPVGNDFDNAVPQGVRIALVGPDVPVVDFEWDPATPQGSELVTFTSTTTLDGVSCGTACDYFWEFDDGGVATREVALHQFTTIGVHAVTLTVTSPFGTMSSRTKSVVVSPPAVPVAKFTAAPTSPAVGVVVTFNATQSTVGPGGSIVRYVWDFGDNSPPFDSGSTPAASHAYGTVGTFVVTLTVTDNLGRQDIEVVSVTVQ